MHASRRAYCKRERWVSRRFSWLCPLSHSCPRLDISITYPIFFFQGFHNSSLFQSHFIDRDKLALEKNVSPIKPSRTYFFTASTTPSYTTTRTCDDFDKRFYRARTNVYAGVTFNIDPRPVMWWKFFFVTNVFPFTVPTFLIDNLLLIIIIFSPTIIYANSMKTCLIDVSCVCHLCENKKIPS